MQCTHCGAANLRTSRLRLLDIPRFLLFQYPVRCRNCRERDYIGFLLALNLRQAARVRRSEERAKRDEQTSDKSHD